MATLCWTRLPRQIARTERRSGRWGRRQRWSRGCRAPLRQRRRLPTLCRAALGDLDVGWLLDGAAVEGDALEGVRLRVGRLLFGGLAGATPAELEGERNGDPVPREASRTGLPGRGRSHRISASAVLTPEHRRFLLNQSRDGSFRTSPPAPVGPCGYPARDDPNFSL